MENARSGLNLFLQKNRQPTDIDVSNPRCILTKT